MTDLDTIDTLRRAGASIERHDARLQFSKPYTIGAALRDTMRLPQPPRPSRASALAACLFVPVSSLDAHQNRA
jgi:hypothetical protein